ncbi:MAG: PP2C family protein-serine/threonine phosphatase [Planctomycetota bacterium]|jgi:sigma-B regulation protein RsbU (phosphoserine phosphatase)
MTFDNHQMDLALAAEVQAALLPKQCPQDCAHQVAGVGNRMCATIGGDFYDFLRLNEDQIAILIGDVVGHGVRAALLMSQIMGYLRSTAEDRSRPFNVIRGLNEMLIDIGDQTNTVLPCSLLYTVIDIPTGMGFMVNAGHPRPIVCDRHLCKDMQFREHDLVLGVQPFEPTEICHTFVPGERLVLYTDGIVDAADAAHELFGEERLREVLHAHNDVGPQQCADAVMAAVAEFRGQADQPDDETIVVIDRQ